MTKFSLAAASAFVLFAGAASAADLYTKAPPPPPPPVLSWTGFYVGVNGGVAAMNGPSMSYVDGAINAYVPVTVDPGMSGAKAIGGVHAGFNYQLSGPIVVGMEADWDWTNLKNSAAPGLLCSGPPFRVQCGGVSVLTDNAFLQTAVNWLASVRGRFGYSFNNQWLVYGTGGIAFADVNYTGNLNCTGVIPTFCRGGGQFMRSSASDTRVGAVFGAGVEFKPARNWVLGAEYLYYHFEGDGSSTASWNFSANGAPAPFFECATGQACGQFTYRGFDVHSGRLRLSYQFQP